MFQSRKNLGYTAEDHAAFQRRPPTTLASWKRDGQADDEIIRKFNNILPKPSIEEVRQIKRKDVYSFRAESVMQLEQFEWFCNRAGRPLSISSRKDEGGPKIDVEIETHASIGLIQLYMRKVSTENLMLKTLKQCRLSENNFEDSVAVS